MLNSTKRMLNVKNKLLNLAQDKFVGNMHSDNQPDIKVLQFSFMRYNYSP